MTTPQSDYRRHIDYGTLVADLRDWARGDYRTEAAVDLLAAHGVWLRRPDFVDHCGAYTAPEIRDLIDVRAWLDFDEAARIATGGPDSVPASDSELQILAIAAGLADAQVDRTLHDLVTGLDDRNVARVLDAVAHAAGWHQTGQRHTTTGHLDTGEVKQ